MLKVFRRTFWFHCFPGLWGKILIWSFQLWLLIVKRHRFSENVPWKTFHSHDFIRPLSETSLASKLTFTSPDESEDETVCLEKFGSWCIVQLQFDSFGHYSKNHNLRFLMNKLWQNIFEEIWGIIDFSWLWSNLLNSSPQNWLVSRGKFGSKCLLEINFEITTLFGLGAGVFWVVVSKLTCTCREDSAGRNWLRVFIQRKTTTRVWVNASWLIFLALISACPEEQSGNGVSEKKYKNNK